MDPSEIPHEPEMHRREISLADGRYLIFYSFDSPDPEVVEPEDRQKRPEI